MKILLAGGDADLVDLLAFVFVREGYRVVTAADGEQALAQWQAERPHLVLLDVELAAFDGLEVCRRIRHESNTPLILLAARHEVAEVLRGWPVGVDDYVLKPFSHRHLAARVRAALHQDRSDRAAAPMEEVRADDSVFDELPFAAVPSDQAAFAC